MSTSRMRRVISLGLLIALLAAVLALLSPTRMPSTTEMDTSSYSDQILRLRCGRPQNLRLIVTATAYAVGDGYTPSTVVWAGGSVWVGTLAVSHDLIWLERRRVCVDGWPYIVRDLMDRGVRGKPIVNSVDIFMKSREEALRWGKRIVVLEVLE